jgi:hypothetical protein
VRHYTWLSTNWAGVSNPETPSIPPANPDYTSIRQHLSAWMRTPPARILYFETNCILSYCRFFIVTEDPFCGAYYTWLSTNWAEVSNPETPSIPPANPNSSAVLSEPAMAPEPCQA